MNALSHIETQELQWFAVKLKARQNGGRRTVELGAEFESYVGRDGRARKRKIKGTGARQFVPEFILRNAGFEVFLPVRKEWRIKNRFNHEKQLVAYPLLVNWMFVGWPRDQARWHELMRLDVVSGMAGAGGKPVRMPHKRMVDLMRRWGGGMLAPACHRYMRTAGEFYVGSEVEVIDGPFNGFPAKVIEIVGENSKVLVDIFGRDTMIELQSRQLFGLGAGENNS